MMSRSLELKLYLELELKAGAKKSWILELELGAEGRSCSLELERDIGAEARKIAMN